MQKGETREVVAKLAGVSHDTVRKVEKILESAPKHIKDKARSGELKINTAYKEMQRELNETNSLNEKTKQEYKSGKGANKIVVYCRTVKSI